MPTPICRCGDAQYAHQHFGRHGIVITYCAYRNLCGCKRYKRRRWWHRRAS